ncbi:Hsp70 family protein [Georgenia thermotolerans]|nr:Hsp70 family protein [Georgenia thermotolerans]
MAYVVGIDIGTSFVAAAITRLGGAGHEAPQLLHLGTRSTAAPSVIYLGEDGQLLVGEAAERRGLTDPHRVVRESKRRVGDPVPLVVGDQLVAPQDVFAALARWVVDRATEQEGEAPERVVVAHPAGWGGYKTGLLREALAGVGLGDAALISEPEAAALHYAGFERVDVGSTIAVYDLGGGTFDVAVLRKAAADTFDVLGTPEGLERLGGADFDEAVFRHVTTSLDGALAALDTADPAVLLACSRLRRECTEAKEALSGDSETTVPVLLPGVHTQVRLVRAEFEGLIEGPVRESVETLRHALSVAEVDPGELSAVLLVGGSSRVPLVAELVSAELGRPVAVDADPKASICLGAALAAAFPGAAEGATVTVDDAAPSSDAAAGAPVPDEDRAVGAAAPGTGGAAYDAPTLPLDARLPAPVGAAGGGPWLVGTRRGAKVAAVLAGVVGITMLTAVAGQTPEVVHSLLPPTLNEAQAGTPNGAATGTTPGASATGTGDATTPGKGAAGPTSGTARPAARRTTAGPTPEATPTPGAPSSTAAQPSTPAAGPSAPRPAGTGTPSTTGTSTPGATGTPSTPATQAPPPSTSPAPSPSPTPAPTTPAPATEPPSGGTTGQEDPTTTPPAPTEPTSPAESPSTVQGDTQLVEAPAGTGGTGG